jgi:HSF-type DNA-binding
MTQEVNKNNNKETKDINEDHKFAVPLPRSQTNYGSQQTSSSPPKSNLPAFLNKLYGMVNSPDTDPWVYWNDKGVSFIIPNSQALAEQVLGRHFKHNNFSSFVRQLNMYGFHKVPHLNHGVLHNDGLPEVWEFTNENFHRNEPGRMQYIIRKKGEAERARAAARQQTPPFAKPEYHINDTTDIAIARAEIHTVAARQEMIRQEMGRLASSTESLWKYALETRHRCHDQQEKLDKLIKFLSEAFRQRASSSDLPNKVRGLLEGPGSSPFEELSGNSPLSTPMTPEQGQWDVMKMMANGKVPVELQEIIQQYFQNMCQGTSSVANTTSPASAQTSDALTTYQAAANNALQLDQVQDWVDHTDQTLNGLGIDLNQEPYGDYLKDSHFAFDPFMSTPNPDPSLDMFPSESPIDASIQPWMSQFLDPEQLQDTNIIGQKRKLQEEDSPSKKRRI